MVVSIPAYRRRSADSSDGDFRRGVYAFVRGVGPRAERRGGMVAHEHQAVEWKSSALECNSRKSPASAYFLDGSKPIQSDSGIRISRSPNFRKSSPLFTGYV